MNRLTRRPAVAIASVYLVLATLPLPAVWAQEASQAEGKIDTPPGSIDQVPDFLKTGQYEEAIAVLRGVINDATASGNFDALRRGYLLLVKTYTVRGNFYDSEGDQTSADLYHKEARALIVDCLQVDELRHTAPDSPLEYPPEMYEMFDEVRGEIFGSFRVLGLEPPDAFVILSGDTLRTLEGQDVLGDVDIPIGSHEIVIAYEGYRTINDNIIVSPGVTVERSYELAKPRGKWWYIGWGSLAAAGATGVAMALTGGSSDPPPEAQPLPGPPPPPR